MAGAAPIFPRVKFTDSSGTPINGGTLTTYQAGTTTLITTYQDNDLSTENTNPITLDANGECLLFLDEDYRYKFLLKDSTGATVSGWPVDNIVAGMDSTTIVAAATAAASASATAAAASATAAATSSSTALAATKIYATTVAGLAAVANGEYFYVPSTSSYDFLTLYKDNAGVAEEVKRTASATLWDDQWHERLFAAQARYFEERRTRSRDTALPKAAVIVLLGQSNNTPGVNSPALSGTPSTNAYMPVGGTALGYFDFYAGNAAHPCHWNDVATASQYVEATSEGPGGGMIAALEGVFPRMYVCSAALGGNPILTLAGAGPRSNLYALVHKMCDHARTAGYEPVVAFTSVHGEANMSGAGLLSEANYYTYAMDYYRMAQRVAAQAMDMPDYVAPIVFFTPVGAMANDDARAIINAVVRISRDIPNGILAGSISQWGMNTDQIHNGPNTGTRERGEYAGFLLRNYWLNGQRAAAPVAVNAVRSGTTVTVTFDQEVEQRNTILFGTGLSANAYLGVEYDDAGSAIKVNSGTFSGRTAAFVLNSAPVGAAGSQYIRFGMQVAIAGAFPANTPGCLIAAANDNGEVSIYDGTVRSYRYVAPYKLAVRT